MWHQTKFSRFPVGPHEMATTADDTIGIDTPRQTEAAGTWIRILQ